MEHRFTSLPPDPFMCSSDEKQSRSPLALYSEYQRMDIELRPPHAMPTSHWHGQVEVNVPFDGDVEYLINNEVVRIEKGYITLFWACTPHQLTRPVIASRWRYSTCRCICFSHGRWTGSLSTTSPMGW